jgi:hypothetical protein
MTSSSQQGNAVRHDINHDFLTRVYLRHYAFLRRIYPHQPPTAVFHFATLGVSVLLSAALLALGFRLTSRLLHRPVAPWEAHDGVVIALSLGLVFLPGWFVDRRMQHLRVVDEELIMFFGARDQRLRWWLAVLLFIPLGRIVAACFAALRASG